MHELLETIPMEMGRVEMCVRSNVDGTGLIEYALVHTHARINQLGTHTHTRTDTLVSLWQRILG